MSLEGYRNLVMSRSSLRIAEIQFCWNAPELYFLSGSIVKCRHGGAWDGTSISVQLIPSIITLEQKYKASEKIIIRNICSKNGKGKYRGEKKTNKQNKPGEKQPWPLWTPISAHALATPGPLECGAFCVPAPNTDPNSSVWVFSLEAWKFILLWWRRKTWGVAQHPI